jgi:3-oxoacyl-[acyl-carrier protein] reductase
MAMKNLVGRVALVTGGSRGIGAGIAVALARAGADVAVNYRERDAAAQQVCREIEALGRRATVVRADVSRADEVRRMVAEAEARLGPVDILVNNAAMSRPQKIEEIAEADWDEMMAVNLKSAFLVTQAVVAGMRVRRWGRIVNISSQAAQTGGIVGAHYAASKAGMLGLTRACASALAKEGVTANSVCPALIKTEMLELLPARPEMIPLGHFGEVEDVAAAVVMLAENDYITGQTIFVNGGWYVT